MTITPVTPTALPLRTGEPIPPASPPTLAPAEATGAKPPSVAALLPNPRIEFDRKLGAVVLEYHDASGKVVTRYPNSTADVHGRRDDRIA